MSVCWTVLNIALQEWGCLQTASHSGSCIVTYYLLLPRDGATQLTVAKVSSPPSTPTPPPPPTWSFLPAAPDWVVLPAKWLLLPQAPAKAWEQEGAVSMVLRYSSPWVIGDGGYMEEKALLNI